MSRWDFSHGRVGVNAPSWLTFELYQPYFDGGQSPCTPIQFRGPVVAAQLFVARDATAPRAAMVMPASFRTTLVEESRLYEYRVQRPTDLADSIAGPAWQAMSQVYRRWVELDAVDRAGLIGWLVAACLPDAVLDLVPDDLPAAACADELTGLVQYGRAMAAFQRDGLVPATTSAFAPLVEAPAPTLAHLQAIGVYSYLLARHAVDWSAAAGFAQTARQILDQVAGRLPQFDAALWRARVPLREVTLAERTGQLDRAVELLDQATAGHAALAPASPAQDAVALELLRRIIDKRVEIAVKRNDTDGEAEAIAAGIRVDPYCVKLRMQSAQAAQRRGDLAEALAGYLLAARLGPFGTGFALLRAAQCAGQSGRTEVARQLCERAYRAAPRSAQTRDALVRACRATGDEPMAEVFASLDASAQAVPAYQANWHYRMYGGYLNLGPSASPCLYATIPTWAYQFAAQGQYPRIDLQRVMPPAFRANLARESGLIQFAVDRPDQLPPGLRTQAWEQLCQWVAEFAAATPGRQLLTCKVLYHLGFNQQVIQLLPERDAASLHEPAEFHQYAIRDLASYAEHAGRGQDMTPTVRFEMIDNPECPMYLQFTGATFAVVYHGREKKSATQAQWWRHRAQELLTAILADDDYTEFEKVMLHSRFYRGVGFVPFMSGDWPATNADMDQAIDLARQVQAHDAWQEYLRRENLHAALESRAKVAWRTGDQELATRLTAEALAVDVYHPMSNIEQAESLTRKGELAEAADAYLRAARLGPYGTAIAYHMAGQCWQKLGDPLLAQDCYLHALRIDPYAISAARGWKATAEPALVRLAEQYASGLEAWGEQRRAARRPQPLAMAQ